LRNRPIAAVAAALALLFSSLSVSARAEERATITWKGESHPLGTLGGREFVVSDAARALGFTVASDPGTNVLTVTGFGHQILLGPGTAQVPVDRRIVPISAPAHLAGGSLYAPADFFEKVLFPLAGAAGTYDAARRAWTLTAAGPLPVSIEVAVVHVAPTTQVVLRLSAAAKTATALSDKGFQIRFPETKIDPPFPEKKFDDPLVAAVHFAADTATVDFRDPGLTARAYPLTSPDRLVIEVGRRPAAAAPVEPAAPAPASVPALTIVVDPGHGGVETGAIGPGGLQEKEATLEIARRLAAALPKVLACRTVLTRDTDVLISLDDRTSIANHEKADLFLSVHANSSRAASAKGSETYYLSLEASDKIAQEVAREENQAGAAASAAGGGDASANPALDFILWDLAQSAHLKESSELADAIQSELNAVSDTANRGIKQAPFRVLVGASMPAVLVEVAFISNAEEEKKLKNPEFQQAVAEAVARAVARFFSRRMPGAARPTPATAPAPAP
jgi:N-acetylmuramoyl-L-alanine amidase